MLDVGWPDPALVEERIESTRSCAARSATVSRPIVEAECVVVICGLSRRFAFDQRYSPSEHAAHRPAQAGWRGQRPGANRHNSPSALNLETEQGQRREGTLRWTEHLLPRI